jgi:hypothetical protein
MAYILGAAIVKQRGEQKPGQKNKKRDTNITKKGCHTALRRARLMYF